MKIDYNSILNQIAEAYKSVRATNGYRFDLLPERVYRVQVTRADIPEYPAVIIAPAADVIISPGISEDLREWTVETGVLWKDSDDLPKDIESLKDDCLAALEGKFRYPADPITSVEVVEIDPTAITKGENVAGFKINLAIQYFRNR